MRAALPDARRPASAGAAVLAVAVATALFARPPDRVRLEAGGLTGSFLRGDWSDSDRTDLNEEAGALDPESAGAARFRFRAARPSAEIVLPVAPRGAGGLRLALRAMARVRTTVSFHAAGQPAAEISVPRGRWARHEVTVPAAEGEPTPVALALQPLPMVRVPDVYVSQPELWVADIEASSTEGLRFTPAAWWVLGGIPLAIGAFALAVGAGVIPALAAALAAAALTVVLAGHSPVALLVAATRLLPFALAVGLLVRAALSRARSVPPRIRAALAGWVVLGTLFHASLAFVPGYDPYDMEVHVRRTRDLGGVPLDYAALLRYGSHLPTETQTFGTATAALGEKTLIPYSPLPYVAFYALHRFGIDLHWGMAALDAALAMAVAAWLWVVAQAVWDAAAAWMALALYTLDLPIWHHLARAHVPASFGNALATAALLFLVRRAGDIDTARRVAWAGGLLAVAMLGYSSLVVFFGLFGLALVLLLAADARALAAPAKKGLMAALVLGGLAAGALFYFHYVPGLLVGVHGIQEEPDLFQARTYLIFHNESRQSIRVWAAGFVLPLAAGWLASPFALRRAWPPARPVLGAWLASWPLVMLAKEPFLFPRPLRWAKEDQFIAPLLALLVAGAIGGLPRRWMRWGAAAAVVAVALWLQLGDFRIHLSGQMP